MKKLNKIISILFVLFFTVGNVCLAATTSSEKAKLEIVENNICTIKINDSSEFEKKIIDKDLEKKEITIGLKVSNNAETILSKPTEIFLVIDNSTSMEDEVEPSVTRIKAVTDAAKSLATDLLKFDTVKIGVVRFSTGDNEGTITDATLINTPTESKQTVLNSISSIVNSPLGIRTNIDAGITLASQNFSEDVDNKFIILLTDGVPNTAVGGPTLTYSGQTATKTLAKLQQIKNSGIEVFTVMTGVPDVKEPSSNKTYKALAEEIFGTTEEPTVGKFYYINDSQINETITKTVKNNFTDTSKNDLTNLKIYDYFPDYIIENFDFSYVKDPNIGNVSAKIDLENKCIVWTIDRLEPGKVANLSYKLTLKANIDSSILDKVLDTNTKVDITAKEIIDTKTSDVTPKVKVTIPSVPEPDPTPDPTPVPDPTPAPTPIPQTGDSNIILPIVIVMLSISSIYFFIKLRKTF